MVYTNSRTNGSRKSRANYSREFKQRLVEAANQPGVSVSKLAQEHGAMPTDVMPKLRYSHAWRSLNNIHAGHVITAFFKIVVALSSSC
jgi:hypothetical protein